MFTSTENISKNLFCDSRINSAFLARAIFSSLVETSAYDTTGSKTWLDNSIVLEKDISRVSITILSFSVQHELLSMIIAISDNSG